MRWVLEKYNQYDSQELIFNRKKRQHCFVCLNAESKETLAVLQVQLMFLWVPRLGLYLKSEAQMTDSKRLIIILSNNTY